MILCLRCPKCHHSMNYQWDQRALSTKKKRCVYCGKSFTLGSHLLVSKPQIALKTANYLG